MSPGFIGGVSGGPLLDLIGGAPQPEPPRKPTTFEVLSMLIVPALSLVAAIVALQRDQRVVAWALLGVLFLSFAVGFYPFVRTRSQQYLSERRDERVARKAFAEFRKCVRRFTEFAAAPHSRTDTLHAIALEELCAGNYANLKKLCVVPAEVFQPFSLQLRSRVDQQEGNLPNLVDGVEELSLLVRSYTQYCVESIFGQFPENLRPLLTDKAKSSLESFRERYVVFLDDYSKYLETLEESFSKPRIGPHYFPRPKPL
jgi:hypothetical protein